MGTTEPTPRELLQLDPEEAIREHHDRYKKLIEKYRAEGRDDVADIIENRINRVLK